MGAEIAGRRTYVQVDGGEEVSVVQERAMIRAVSGRLGPRRESISLDDEST
jgi:hypothetical protein